MSYFYCYSANLAKFFCENGLAYICSDVHKKTNKQFWVFKSSETITELLSVWRSNKHLNT